MIQFGHQMPDYDSPATQSTSESHQEVSGMSEGSLNEHNDHSGLLHFHFYCIHIISLENRKGVKREKRREDFVSLKPCTHMYNHSYVTLFSPCTNIR
jgi:hypothetical protein